MKKLISCSLILCSFCLIFMGQIAYAKKITFAIENFKGAYVWEYSLRDNNNNKMKILGGLNKCLRNITVNIDRNDLKAAGRVYLYYYVNGYGYKNFLPNGGYLDLNKADVKNNTVIHLTASKRVDVYFPYPRTTSVYKEDKASEETKKLHFVVENANYTGVWAWGYSIYENGTKHPAHYLRCLNAFGSYNLTVNSGTKNHIYLLEWPTMFGHSVNAFGKGSKTYHDGDLFRIDENGKPRVYYNKNVFLSSTNDRVVDKNKGFMKVEQPYNI